jgi:hypothetical protein
MKEVLPMKGKTRLFSLILTIALVLGASACSALQKGAVYGPPMSSEETPIPAITSIPTATPPHTPAQTSNALMSVPTAVAQSMDKDKAGSIALTYLPAVMAQYGKEPGAMNFTSTYTYYDRWANMDSALLTMNADGTPFWHIQVIIDDEFFVVVQMSINAYSGDLYSYDIIFNKGLVFHNSAGCCVPHVKDNFKGSDVDVMNAVV